MSEQQYTVNVADYDRWYRENVSAHGTRITANDVFEVREEYNDFQDGERYAYIVSSENVIATHLPARFLIEVRS